eukprot:6685_1
MQHSKDPPPEIQRLIDNADAMHLNALQEDDTQSDSSKDALYLNLKQLHKARSRYEHDSVGSGYRLSDKSMSDDLDDTDSMAIFAGLSTDVDSISPTETPLAKCCGAFWNLFKYFAICLALSWMLFLFMMLLQPSMGTIRSIISYIDPTAANNRPVPHRINSKESCAVYDLNKFSQEFNVYLLFHFGRWFLYSLIYRNRLLLWMNSVSWAFIQFFIASCPVFNLQWIGQCWYWYFVDILFTNMLGIELGYIVMKKTGTLELYDVFTQIFEGKISFFMSFICIWCTIILFQLEQLLMFIIFDQTFWYNTNGWMIWCRLLIYSLSSMFSVNQLFYWVRDNGYQQSLQSLSWIIVLNCLVLFELLLAIKTYSEEYH